MAALRKLCSKWRAVPWSCPPLALTLICWTSSLTILGQVGLVVAGAEQGQGVLAQLVRLGRVDPAENEQPESLLKIATVAAVGRQEMKGVELEIVLGLCTDPAADEKGGQIVRRSGRIEANVMQGVHSLRVGHRIDVQAGVQQNFDDVDDISTIGAAEKVWIALDPNWPPLAVTSTLCRSRL